MIPTRHKGSRDHVLPFGPKPKGGNYQNDHTHSRVTMSDLNAAAQPLNKAWLDAYTNYATKKNNVDMEAVRLANEVMIGYGVVIKLHHRHTKHADGVNFAVKSEFWVTWTAGGVDHLQDLATIVNVVPE